MTAETAATFVAALAGGSLLALAVAVEERRRRAPALPPAAGAGSPAVAPGPPGAVSGPSALAAPAAPAAAAAAPPPAAAQPPTTTVLLPVRDEERNVTACLAALVGLAGQPDIRVIDDGSVDATAALAAATCHGEPRLALIAAGPLPAGWRGKVHALSVGARGLGAEWLLLTDADVRLRPAALARALAAAAHWQLDAVSLAGFQEVRGVGENLVVPPIFALLDCLLGSWEEAAANGGEPVANGQFLLLRRAAWESCGGFAAVRNESLDDVAIAVAMRRNGWRTGFLRAPELLSVRMYIGWREAIRGWRRNLGGLLGARRGTLLAALATSTLPALAIAACAAAGFGVPAALLWGAGAAASALLRAGSGHLAVYGLLYPLDSLLVAALLAAGANDRRRGRLLSWKGRELQL